MKKQLLYSLTIIALLIANFSYSQQNRTAAANYRGALSNNNSIVSPKKGTQAVTTTTTSTCMSINLPPPAGWTLVNYGTGTPIFADGFVNGPSIYADREKAMYFDASASANTMITQVYVGFDHAYSATPTKTVAVKFYDGTSGTPGAAMGSGTISMGTIMTDVSNNQYSLIMFPTPINLPVSKRFFASVDISGLQWTSTVKDSLSIVSNTDNQTIPSLAWEKWSTNAWYNMGSTSSWTLDISLLIHPFLTQAPISATFSTSSNTVCTGKSITYNSAGSTSPGTYDWYFGAIATPTATGVTALATYTAAGTYTTSMIVEDACGSFGITQKTISVIPSPTVTASPASNIVCSGKPVTLSGGGASTYAWTGGITNAVSFTPAATANYTVTGTAANGCTNTAIASVVVNANPTVTANSSTASVCNGNSVTLNGGGASTYTWTGGVTNNVAFVPTSTNSYTVTGTAGNTCTSTAVVSVTVAPNPTVTATPSATTVCSGNSVTLNGGGASTYAWTGGITNGTAFAPAATTNYTVTGTGANGCNATAVATVSVNTTPTVTANSTASAVCAGSPVTLTGGGASTYTWTSGVTNGAAFTPTATNNYTVTGAAANGCTKTASISVNVNTLPTVTANSSASLICTGNTVTLNGGGASTYTWSGSVSNNVAFSPTVTGNYTVTGTDANGCQNTATVGVIVSACTGIANVTENVARFVLYPNPNNGDFTITLTGLNNTPSVEIYNSIGKLVYQNQLTAEKNTINTNLASGIYFVNLIENGQVIAVQKLICN